jgi:hypothetical protein
LAKHHDAHLAVLDPIEDPAKMRVNWRFRVRVIPPTGPNRSIVGDLEVGRYVLGEVEGRTSPEELGPAGSRRQVGLPVGQARLEVRARVVVAIRFCSPRGLAPLYPIKDIIG